MRLWVIIVCLAGLVGGCAETGSASRAFVTPRKYDHLECKQLRATLAAARLQHDKTDGLYDNGGPGLGFIVYGPDLIKLKGEREILEQAIAEKNCAPE